MSAPYRLARGVTITRRQISEEEIYYLVRDPRAGTFLRMGEVEAALLRLLDGTRTLSEVAAALRETRGFNVGAAAIETFVGALTRRGLVESRVFDPAAFREEWAQQQRARRRTLGQLFGTLTYLKVHLFNPQRLFPHVVGPLRFVWTRAFVAVTLAVMALAGVMSLLYREEILRSAHLFYVRATSSGGELARHAVIFYGVLFVVVAVHELAHGLTCAHFGGKVTDMGFILFYLQVPGMYCDITDAYSFEKRSHRLWTTFAGSYTGLLLASLGVFAWWMTEPGDPLNGAGIMLMFVGGPPALAFNWNPLLRLDGYYMLMDLLEAPNLMDNSFRYLGHQIRTRLLRVPAEPMEVPRRLRRVYVVYGVCSFLFIAPWVVYMPVVAYYIFSSMFGTFLAVPIAAAIGWRLLSRHASKVAATLRYTWLSHRGAAPAAQRGGARTALVAAAGLAACALLLSGPRFAVRVNGAGVLEAAHRFPVRVGWPGFVRGAAGWPLEGARVRAGDLLVRLENPDLAAELRDAALEANALRAEAETLEARGDPSSAAARRLLQRASEEKLANLSGRVATLELRAPGDGVVLTPRLQDRDGTYLRAGQTWCELGGLERLRLRVSLTERDLGLIEKGSEAEIRGPHLPGRRFAGRVVQMPAGRRMAPPSPDPSHPAPGGGLPVSASIAPAGGETTVDGSLDVEVEVDNASGLLVPGMTASVRMYGERLTVLQHAARWGRRLFKGKIWW